MTRSLVLVVLALAIPAAAAPRKRVEPCPAGRFLVQGTPLLAGAASSAADAIEIGTTRIAIGTACAPVAPKQYKGTAKGTKVKAKWSSCTGFTGKVTLTGTIVDGCATLNGTVKAKRFKGRVQGQRSSCGDGVVDAGGGEQCDPPGGGACDAQCRRPASFMAATIGAAGGEITSSDGRLALDVPPGALPADTVISIRPLEPGELPASLAGVDAAYELGPDGLQFAAPVVVTFGLGPALAPSGELGVTLSNLVTVSTGGGTPEPVADQRVVVDDAGDATVTGTLMHFTIIASGYGLRADVTVSAVPGPILGVNQPFEIAVNARLLGAAGVVQDPPLGVVHTNLTTPGIVVYRGAAADTTIGTLRQNLLAVTGRVPYQCGPTPGTGTYLGRVSIDEFKPLDVQLTIQCRSSTTTTTRPTTTTSTTTRSTTTTTSTRPATTTSTISTTSTTSTTVTTTTVVSTSTTTSTTSTTTTTRINCCDCPLPRGCASGPDVLPGNCVEFGCVFVTDAVCTDAGDCTGALPTTTSSTTTSSTSSTSSATSTTSTTVTTPSSTTTSTLAGPRIRGPEGIRRVDRELFGDDDDDLAEPTVAALREGTLVSVAANNGWAIVDYVTGEVVVGDYLAPRPFPHFEAVPLGGSSTPGAGLDVQAIVQVGPNGPGITHYDLAAGDFGFTQVFPGSPTCFDAVAYGGDALSGGLVLACGRGLSAVEPHPGGFFNTTGYSQFPTTEGAVLSGFRRAKGGPIVAVTEGTPGKIWKHPATGDFREVPVPLGASENNPRRVRCAPNTVCAVSNFGSDSLTILTWDASDNIAVVGNVSVGDGPVGIDIRLRTDGNVEVVSSGFNDNSYSITVLRQNGSTVSNQKKAVPTGCTAPGHVIWGPGNEIILSCNGSDRIVLVPNP